MQKHTDMNTGKMLITFITRPGLPGEEKLLRTDPFLAPPEMEQVPILQEISGEQQQNRQNMEQQVEIWGNWLIYIFTQTAIPTTASSTATDASTAAAAATTILHGTAI